MSSSISEKVPTTLPDLTPAWLTGVLRDCGAIGDGDTVTGWSPTRIAEGVGLLSEISKLELAYDSSSAPVPSLIVKFDTTNEQNHAVGQGLQVYEREAKFYQEFADDLGGVCPKVYFSYVDPATGAMSLLMEDLTDYRPGDQNAGATLAEAKLAIDAAARLHAETWGAQSREDLAWWPTIDGSLYSTAIGGAVIQAIEPTMANFPEAVLPEIVAASERYKAAVPDMHRRMAEGPQSLIHGDFRLDNFMFGAKPEHRPFVVLDMQGPIVSKGIHDVAYLLSQSMDPELRRAHERDLVNHYQGKLAEYGVTGYSAEQGWDDYRLAVLHCLEYAVVIAGTLEPGNERGRIFVEGCLSRSCQAIADLDLLSLLP